MKRLLLSFVLMASVLSASAFSYQRAREQALFLSDKMAYELNLTDAQYDLAYQINLDYFLNISSQRDLYGIYWQYRDADLSYILYDWQYSLYRTIDYFYQPLRWINSAWYFPVYSRYSRTHYFFGRPGVYISYRGGWRPRSGRAVSPYASHRPHGGRGMRDHHYPGAGRVGGPGHHHGGGSHHDGYRPGNRNGTGYGRGHSQGHGRNDRRGQGNVGGQSQDHGRGQGNVGGQSQGHGRGQGNVGGQSQGNGRGQGNVGGQSQGGQRGGRQQIQSGGNGQSRSSSNGSGRAGGRSYGR